MGPINKKIIFNLNFYDPFNKFLEDAKSKVYIYIYIPSFSTKKKKNRFNTKQKQRKYLT